MHIIYGRANIFESGYTKEIRKNDLQEWRDSFTVSIEVHVAPPSYDTYWGIFLGPT